MSYEHKRFQFDSEPPSPGDKRATRHAARLAGKRETQRAAEEALMPVREEPEDEREADACLSVVRPKLSG